MFWRSTARIQVVAYRNRQLEVPVPRFTQREEQIVQALLAGCGNRDIAARLGTSPHTVKNQLTTLYRKVGVKSRLQFLAWLHRQRDGQ